MDWHEKFIAVILFAVILLSATSILAYPFLQETVRELVFFTLIVFSAWSSVLALAVSLWTFYKYEETVENPIEQLSDKTSDFVEDLNEGFLEELIDSLIEAEARFASMPERKQKKVVKVVERYSDIFFERVEEMPDEKPSKRIDKAEEKTE